jgi:hypothetical protein
MVLTTGARTGAAGGSRGATYGSGLAVTPDRLQGASMTTASEVRMAAGDATTMVTSVRA